MKNITVIGGGNSAHTLIPLLSKTRFTVNLLTRKPDKWQSRIELEYMRPSGEHIETWYGDIDKISDKPEQVIPQADIIILCMPVSAYRKALDKVGALIEANKKVYVGTVYGQAGFNWMTKEMAQRYGLKNIVTFAIGLIPWICRAEKYGSKGIVYGAKPLNLVAVKPAKEFDALNEALLTKISYEWFGHGEFTQAKHFISLTLSVDNQIIHTSRMYGLYLEEGGQWAKVKDVPYFYRNFSEHSAQILKRLDADYTLIRNGLRERYPECDFKWMMDYMKQDNITNDNSRKTVIETFRNSKTLGAIRTPVVHDGDKWVLNKKHRFFYDDVFYGLCIAKWFAQKLDIEVNNIDEVLNWAQSYLGEQMISESGLNIDEKLKAQPLKYGVPESYGMHTLDEVID